MFCQCCGRERLDSNIHQCKKCGAVLCSGCFDVHQDPSKAEHICHACPLPKINPPQEAL